MKVNRFNLRILEDELKILERVFPDLRRAIKDWSELQNDRETWGSVDQEWVAEKRNELEKQLTKFREQLATIYDFMGDRGLAEFVPTRIRNERENGKVRPIPVEDDGEDVLDLLY